MYIEIKTDRLLLRPLDIKDLNSVHEYASDIENTKYMIYLPNETKEDSSCFLTRVTKEWQKEIPSFYEFAIILDDKQIGAVSVCLNDQRLKGELGWIVNKKYWRKGYATEAAMAVRDFAINVLKVPELVAHCDYRNIVSSKIMKKLGLTLVNDTGLREYSKTGEIARELVFSYSVAKKI